MESSPKRRGPLPPISLTNIPSEIVIDGILSRLPIRDAVRTSVLSRSWRRRWRSIPSLTFDNLPIAAVDHVLNLHSGPIRSLSISFFSNMDQPTDYYVDRWISALSNDPVPLRSLSLYFNRYSAPHIPLHSTLFSFRNLTRLYLSGCALPTSPGFPVLETLNLTACIFPDGGNVSDFIFNCPLLQKLQLMWVECSCLHIWAPNLSSFIFRGVFMDFALVNAPLLTMTSITLVESWEYYSVSVLGFGEYDEDNDEGGEPDEYLAKKCNLVKVFAGANSIEKLDLLWCSLNFLGKFKVPKRIPDFFERLKVLTLAVDLRVVKENLALLCLLRSAPNLQELDIRKAYYGEDDTTTGDEFWRQQDHLELSKLHVFKVDLITSPGTELEFINFILQAVPELKKMVVNITMVADIASGKDKSILELKAKGLMEYWRASTRAEIVFQLEPLKLKSYSQSLYPCFNDYQSLYPCFNDYFVDFGSPCIIDISSLWLITNLK